LVHPVKQTAHKPMLTKVFVIILAGSQTK
jgi:hypothetical protein